MAIKWLVPSVSRDLRDRMRREAYVTNEIIIRTELLKAQGKLNVMKNEEENPNEPETEETSLLQDDNKCDNYLPQWWVEFDDESSWLFTNRLMF